jgi:hypothetical protein
MGWHDQDGQTAARIARLRWDTGKVTEQGTWTDPRGKQRPYWVWRTDWKGHVRTHVVLDRHPTTHAGSGRGRHDTRDLRWLRRMQRRGMAIPTP